MSSGEGFKSKYPWKNTETFQKLQQIYGPKVTLQQLREVAISACNNSNLHLSLTRAEKSRSGSKLILWYEKNWDFFEQFLKNEQEIDQIYLFPSDDQQYDFDNQQYDSDNQQGDYYDPQNDCYIQQNYY